MSGRRLVAAGAVLALAAGAAVLAALPAGPAGAFGTIGSQGSEHEYITRAALACPAGTPSDGSCFEPVSLDQLAGKAGTFGAVGAPDADETFTTAAHCDDADYLAVAGYPRSAAGRDAAFRSCRGHLRDRFGQGVSGAAGVLTGSGDIAADQVDLGTSCTFVLGVPGRAKCNALEGFGRALHGVQDFYSHSNYVDQAAPGRSISRRNPPGLGLSAPSPLLDLAGDSDPAIPADLTTGYYTPLEAVLSCSQSVTLTGRITHACLNKDEEQIDPVTGAVAPCPGSPVACTPRGAVADNAAVAVAAAITETRRQWDDFRGRLLAEYGPDRGARIVAALTQDHPS